MTIGEIYDSLLSDHPFRIYVDRHDESVQRDMEVYPNEEVARRECPRAYREVCTEWGRAGYGHRRYALPDGRHIAYDSVWWSVPEPGGRIVAHYFVS